jgi:hypothetical protein
MWIADLVKATKAVEDFLGENKWFVTINEVKPCADGGVVFYMSDFTHIKWFQDGKITQREFHSWRS